MPLWKITEKRPSKVKGTKFKQEMFFEEHLEGWIVAGAKTKIEKFNSIGLHYNLAAEAVYKKRSSLNSPFNKKYLQYIIAGLIAFDMGRMIGDNRTNR